MNRSFKPPENAHEYLTSANNYQTFCNFTVKGLVLFAGVLKGLFNDQAQGGALKIRAGGKDFINSVYDSRPFLIIICNRITIYQTPVFIINSIDCIKIMNLQGSIWVSSKCAKSKFNLIGSIQIERYSMGFHLPLRFCVKNGYVEIHWAFSKNI